MPSKREAAFEFEAEPERRASRRDKLLSADLQRDRGRDRHLCRSEEQTSTRMN